MISSCSEKRGDCPASVELSGIPEPSLISDAPVLFPAALEAVSSAAEPKNLDIMNRMNRGVFLPAVVLAAGFSRRMGQDKLLLPVQGQTMLGRVIRAVFAGGLFPVYVVVRPDASPGVRQVLAELGESFARTGCSRAAADGVLESLVVVDCPDAWKGQSASLRAGLRRVMQDARQTEAACSGGKVTGCPGVAVFLGDQPFVSPELVQQLAADFLEHAGAPLAPVCRTSAGPQRGHPVFLPARAFAAVLELEGDTGARAILGTFGLRLFPANDTSALVDIDTWEAYTRFCGELPLNERAPDGTV